MGIASQQHVSVSPMADHASVEIAAAAGARAQGTNLAALLDQFTQSVTQPHDHTVGDFAATVGAIHGELALLARHFGAGASEPEVIDFNDIFPHDAELSMDDVGVAAEEELEHVCRELCR